MMSRETARRLLHMARKDIKAMQALADPSAYEPETFGFHAQQAVEKALKAWLTLQGEAYPPTHNLRFLIDLLEKSGCDVSHLWVFLELIPFAVQFRYDAYDDLEAELDIEGVHKRVSSLLEHVERLLQDVEQ